VEETGGALVLGELVVEAHRLFGLQDVRRNALVLEELQGFGADLQGLEDALGKHHHLGPVLEEFLDVGGLDPGAVAGAGLLPVPLAPAARPELRVLEVAPAARPELRVLEAAPAFDLDPTPGELRDAWRATIPNDRTSAAARFTISCSDANWTYPVCHART